MPKDWKGSISQWLAYKDALHVTQLAVLVSALAGMHVYFGSRDHTIEVGECTGDGDQGEVITEQTLTEYLAIGLPAYIIGDVRADDSPAEKGRMLNVDAPSGRYSMPIVVHETAQVNFQEGNRVYSFQHTEEGQVIVTITCRERKY